MADMFADRQLQDTINKIIDNKGHLPNEKEIWLHYSKMMFLNYPATEVLNLFMNALNEAADEQWFEKKYPKGSMKEDWKYPKRKSVIKIDLRKSRIKKLINENIKITDVAKNYGLKLKNNMTICPFHNDTQASLGFTDKGINIFHCFGCNAKGDIIEFKRRMKKCTITKEN